MSKSRSSEVVTGLFVVSAALLFALFAFKVGRFDLMGLLRSERLDCRAYFLDVKTLQAGSKVKVGGRDVGEITGVHLVEGPWPLPGGDVAAGGGDARHRLVNEVTFGLAYAELRLEPETARVTIAQDSLLSPHFLRLDPGHWPREQPPPPIFEAALPAGIILASAEGAGIDEPMAVARPAVEEPTTILQTLNREFLTPANLAAAQRVIGTLDETLEEGRQLAATLNRGVLAPDNVETLSRMIRTLDEAATDGRAVAARLEDLLAPERVASVDRILDEVESATTELRDGFRVISADLQHLLGDADRVLGETETELAEASRRLQRTLWQGEMALRKIRGNPSTLFFGDDETDLAARDPDPTARRPRGRARPYEQRDEN